jgi:hypothetical protein
MAEDTLLSRLKAHLHKAATAFQRDGKEITDEFFPYIYRQASDQPQWQRAIIKYMPRRPYMEGREIWIRVGDGVEVEGYNIDTGEEKARLVYVTNLNGPDEEKDVIALSRNMIERQSGPTDFSWDEVDRIKYDDWEQGVTELTEEEEKAVADHLAELKEWNEESYAIYAKWLQKKDSEMALNIIADDGRTLIK